MNERARESGKELGGRRRGGGEEPRGRGAQARERSSSSERGSERGADSAVRCKDENGISPELPCEYCWGSILVG